MKHLRNRPHIPGHGAVSFGHKAIRSALRQERSFKIQQLKQRGGAADVFNRTRRKSAARRFFEPKSQRHGIRSIARLQWDR
jgi:hypothetical protein